MAGDAEGIEMLGLMYRHGCIYDLFMKMADLNDAIPKELVRRVEGKSLLELGCGTARFSTFLPEGIKYAGMELNDRFIRYAQKKKRGRIMKGDILKNPLPAADTVLLVDILHHVNPLHTKLLERAKKCAGKKVLVCACFDRKETAVGKLNDRIGRYLDSDGINEERESWLTQQELIGFLKKNGAKNITPIKAHIICEIPVRPRKPSRP